MVIDFGLISYGYYNKLPKTWLLTTEIYFLTVLEARNAESVLLG